MDDLRRWSDRVTHIDVDVEVRTCRRQLGRHCDPNPAVGVLFSDHHCARARDVEQDAIVETPIRDLANHRPDVLGVMVEDLGLEIDVAGRTALAEGGKKYPALEDEAFGKA